MKISRTHIVTGFTRGALLIALSVGLSAAVAKAAENVTLPLVGQAFGDGVELSTQSDGVLDAAHGYYYRISGKCHGTGNYQNYVPPGTDIKKLFDEIQANASASLTGAKRTDGSLPVTPTFLNKHYQGEVSGAAFSLDLFADIDGDGRVTFKVKNVSVTYFNQHISGTIEFEEGAKIVVGVAPVIKMETTARKVGEGAGDITLKVLRSANSDADVFVHFKLVAGTAVNPDDFGPALPQSGILEFPPGVNSKQITIAINNDNQKEDAEKFSVELRQPLAALIGGPRKTVVTIKAND
jgi:hypothetical protein